jgi:hypothetical protein
VSMLTVLTLLKVKPSPGGEKHGERPFWREFGEQYLGAWLRNTDRFIPRPHRVVVMTDSRTYLRYGTSDYAEREVNYIALDATVDAPGFWAKLNMFRVGQGKCLYLDLDNVITGPLDELCALEPDPLVMLDDKRVPRLPNGSAILFDAERCRYIWDSYESMPRTTEREYVARGEDYSRAYDQAFIADCAKDISETGADVPFFQDALPRDYCLNAYSELPQAENWQDSRLIFGCGSAKPHSSTHPAFQLR